MAASAAHRFRRLCRPGSGRSRAVSMHQPRRRGTARCRRAGASPVGIVEPDARAWWAAWSLQRRYQAPAALSTAMRGTALGDQRRACRRSRRASLPCQSRCSGKKLSTTATSGPHGFAGLVARHLDDPELRLFGSHVHQFQQRHADVARQRGALAGRAQQVRDQRGDRALALGAGDADGARPRVLREPQRVPPMKRVPLQRLRRPPASLYLG